MTKKVDAFIVRDFHDSGTLEHFTAGTIVSFDEGAFANYAVSGSVRKPTADDKKDATKAVPVVAPITPPAN